jgi:hypothetical protein
MASLATLVRGFGTLQDPRKHELRSCRAASRAFDSRVRTNEALLGHRGVGPFDGG